MHPRISVLRRLYQHSRAKDIIRLCRSAERYKRDQPNPCPQEMDKNHASKLAITRITTRTVTPIYQLLVTGSTAYTACTIVFFLSVWFNTPGFFGAFYPLHAIRPFGIPPTDAAVGLYLILLSHIGLVFAHVRGPL
ncbi:uncharacterized protein BCR38DRAFT_444968 [Pseudomassariella vexata]|uniref:Uncharacterized protein n=1 Tax=Pseudomassariella vexata TaxID=1141098 RepID=A0A1Y2DK92_9PEZI|nr:uncharacterized protein BCR38DRAFT_444968 [Pseudomassariella vexata]ORY59584.1 hypothetical protein BCR38DRAFT_444968 [Pseudomassariella vexata]